ncbi:MAG: hypothetical protein JW892_00520, partial [Anaerolineae bacterium]|nr:hypothetical protein [Anaerolineae bacterium]
AATRRAADGALNLYLDGALAASGVGSTTDRWSSSLSLGRLRLLSNYYQGQMDEVRVWNTVRSPEEVQAAFRASPSPTTPGLALYYRFNETATTIYPLLDSSPNRNHSSVWAAIRSSASLDYVYRWDVLGGGFLGQSDNVIFRLVAQPGVTAPPNGIPGPYQRPEVGASTPPLRVRGSQVRVLHDGAPVAGALVYHIPAGTGQGATPYMDLTGQPYQTNLSGYLGGYGELNPGDQLVALLPITATEAYTLYHTSAAPTVTGLAAHTIVTPGVQVLIVTAAHPLILFNLDVSLEWDARQDTVYLEQLAYDLQRASEFLYDWTNGQVALGQVHVYHERGNWNTADVRIYANNRMRPSAIQGGVTRTRIEDPDAPEISYEPGIARLGVTWSRYGEAGSNAEDWPRALAHELGHYLLYLDDNYLGFDAAGTLIPVDTCTGAMADPYRGDYPYDEFHAPDDWLLNCEATLSQQRTGRADWTTLQRFYPQVSFNSNTGPSVLPLAVTQVQWHAPATPPTALVDPTFYLMAGGTRVQPGARARVFLFQDDWLIDLGAPRLDRVNARGARVGDRLCVLQPDARQVGCEVIGATDRQLELATYADWQPDIIITPITSRTLHISVTQVSPSLVLQAQLYSESGEVTSPQTLTLVGATYQGTFTTTKPTIAGYVQVWDGVLGLEVPRREAITDFALGGNPAPGSGAWSGAPGSGAWSGTPTLSSDGQVSLYSRELVFPEGEFYALQATTALPQPSAWATIVGQAYRLLASGGAPPLSAASISFQYLGSEVPAGEESWLAIYTWDGSEWDKLPTRLDLDYNTAAAPVAGPGLYVLMASLEIALPEAGWNLFAYPVQATRPVTEALLSIQEVYTTVYGYEGGSWLIYDRTLPALLNTLHTLEFGRGYWISVTQPITLNLKGAALGTANTLAAPLSTLPQPPASFYGPVVGGPGFTPEAGMAVRVWAGAEVCGEGRLQEFEGQLVYLVHVEAACVGPGAQLRFQVGDRWMVTTTSWSTAGIKALPLRSAYQLFLPLVGKME